MVSPIKRGRLLGFYRQRDYAAQTGSVITQGNCACMQLYDRLDHAEPKSIAIMRAACIQPDKTIKNP
jgi:hypothetical protein